MAQNDHLETLPPESSSTSVAGKPDSISRTAPPRHASQTKRIPAPSWRRSSQLPGVTPLHVLGTSTWYACNLPGCEESPDAARPCPPGNTTRRHEQKNVELWPSPPAITLKLPSSAL